VPGEETAPRTDLRQQLREATLRCAREPKPVADSLPQGFQNIDDVIVLLQPLRIAAEHDHDELLATLQRLAEKNFLTGTQAVGKGGIWAALVRGCAAHALGFHAELSETEGASALDSLLNERPARVLVSARPKAHLPLANFVERGGRFTAEAIGRVTAAEIRIRWMGETVLEAPSIEALAR